MALHGAHEVDGAPPRAAEDPFDRSLEALVLVADTETNALEPAGGQPARKLESERLCLSIADIDADHPSRCPNS